MNAMNGLGSWRGPALHDSLQCRGNPRQLVAPMSPSAEPRNPFYFLLLIAGLAFTVTVLALAVIPQLEKRWLDEGELPPASPLSEALREHGLTLVLWEVGAIIVFGLASMALDRVRRWQSERAAATIPPDGNPPARPGPTAPE